MRARDTCPAPWMEAINPVISVIPTRLKWCPRAEIIYIYYYLSDFQEVMIFGDKIALHCHRGSECRAIINSV